MNDYHLRINRVMDYIDAHLSENLTLDELAAVACFSSYHFHRIFQMVQRETLFGYIQRLRLEKSATLLSARPDLPIIDIALECAFSNPASFSRAKLVYNRYNGPYMGDGALFQRLWDQLCSWAGPRGLMTPQTEYMSLYRDDPELTETQKLRVTLAMTVEKFPDDQTMGAMEWQGGLYGCAGFRLNEREYGEAWQWMFQEWLPRSGFYPDDRPALERYLPDLDSDEKDGRHRVEICIPLLPAQA